MNLKNKKIGFVVTGSFCTFAPVFQSLKNIVEEGANVQTVFSDAASSIDSRFGDADRFLNDALEITGNKPITEIEQAEAFGPKKICDVLAIAPATGNTLAKLANGITDTPALMAAKAHLRNLRPLVVAVSSNDALSINLKNIGILLNSKNIYFVPFRQDNPKDKPNSLIADFDLLAPTLKLALEHKQYQPVLV